MRKTFFVLLMLATVSFLLTSCGETAGNTNTPKNTTANNTAVNGMANTTSTGANPEAEVKKLIDDLAANLVKNDAAGLDKIYGDDYMLVTETGEVFTKAQRLEALKSGDLKFEDVSFSDVKVRGYGDTAVATASTAGKSINKGQTQEASYRVTLVFNKTAGGWRLVSSHLSPLPKAAKNKDTTKKDESNTNM